MDTVVWTEDEIRWAERAALERPRTRGECPKERPCPFVLCRHHMALWVSKGGSLCYEWPGVDVLDIPETCSLDVAARGGMRLKEIASLMNVTRQRVDQFVKGAIQKIRDEHLEALEALYPGKDGWKVRSEG